MNGHQTHLAAFGIEFIDNGLDDIADGTHGNDDVGGILGTIIHERSVFTSGDTAHFLHVFRHDVGQSIIVFVLQFASLEIDVGILCRSARDGMIRIQSVFAVSLQCVLVDKLGHGILVGGFHFLNFVRGAETVEEVNERHAAFDGGKMCHGSEVHDFLHRAGGQHGEARLTGAHHVGMVAEDGQGLSRQSAG